ncbi:hypothetical protein CU097_009864 [Rhizopus azygosporus]|uniref:Cytochrome P450 n=1 Tax=Rhizopus azygosporus TaxID=86630 RepID=A0A367JVL1_RHIAZ|nr:hypothetical protein CU097_009864 [Rhizopus azygosporus]
MNNIKLGHFSYLAPNPGRKMSEWHQELGSIYHIKIGIQDWVSIEDVEAANEIFVTKGSATSSRLFYTFGTDVHGEGGRGIVFADYAVYKDYIIPKGTVLLATSLSMNMDPKLYHEPEKLKPGRFLNDNRSMYASSNGSTQNREVFTFGWGRRICPGIYMAENEIFNFCTHLLAKCTIELAFTKSGEKIYPELDRWVEKDETVVPLPYKTRFVQRK